MADHARFSPSALQRTFDCPGWHRLAADLPRVSSPHADRGTYLHSLTSQAITQGGLPPAAEDLDPEDFRQVRACVDYAASFTAPKLVEERVDILGEHCWGTADLIMYHRDSNSRASLLHVVDWKFGFTEVSMEDNKQLLAYTLGAARRFQDLFGEISRFRMTIFQPSQKKPEKTRHVDWSDLVDFERRLKDAIVEAKGRNAPLNPSQSACQFCPAKAVCPELGERMRSLAAISPQDMTAEEVAKYVPYARLAKGWGESVLQLAHSLLTQGTPVPGYKLVESTRSHRRWRDAAVAEQRLRKCKVKVNDLFSKKLISPAQAEKLVPITEIADLIIKPPGTAALVEDSDPRPAYHAIIDEFENLEIENAEA